MKQLTKYSIWIVAVVYLIFVGVKHLCHTMDYARENVCVMTENPRRVIDGLIASGIRHRAGPVMYFLYYEGEYKLSKQTCRYKVGVTQKEYERKIYGEKK